MGAEMSNPLLVTMDEAARLLSVSRRLLDDLRLKGQLATVKIGGRRRVSMAEVQRLAQASETSQTTAAHVPESVPGSTSEVSGQVVDIQAFR